MSELRYESKIDRVWIRGEESKYYDCISTIRFVSEVFSFDFLLYKYDYEDIEKFLVKFIERKGFCKLCLHDDTTITIDSNMYSVMIKLDWQTRAGTLKYYLPYHDCLQAFKDLLADLKKYRMEVIEEILEHQDDKENDEDEDSY